MVNYLRMRKTAKGYSLLGIFLLIYFVVLYYKVSFFPSASSLVLYLYFINISVLILARFPLAWYYNPSKFIGKDFQPYVTVIVPSYNEQDAINGTINRIIESDYPKDRLQIFVYNDGSKDDTKGVILKTLEDRSYTGTSRPSIPNFMVTDFEAPDLPLVTFYDSLLNKGKREGLYHGFKNARGDVVMVIDSDTWVEKDCIKEIVKPLQDSKYSAVSGHTGIKNQEKFLGKIQESNYFISYHLGKKAESVWANVTCLPGCASAYRKVDVLPFIDEWRKQTFLGQKCTYGEDRGLTTLLLRNGHNTVYTPAAISNTICPDNFRKLWKQRVRWKKSFLRECIWQAKFMYKRPIGAALFFYMLFITSLVSPFLTIFYLFVAPVLFGYAFAIAYIAGICLVSLLYGFYSKLYTTFPLSWTISWFFFNALILSFGSLWAWIFSIRNTRWETR